MILRIDFNSERPIYTQLKDRIVEGIASGLLKEGESLPSVRQMAEDLGIHMHTVNKVYAILEKEGFLIIYKRKGVVVNNLFQKRDKSFLKRLSNKIKPVIAEAHCKGINETEFLEKCREIFSSFNKGANNET